MKENVDKYLDHLNRKVIGKSALERTSTDFTPNLMLQIHALSKSKITIYKPLISKQVWGALALLVIGVFGYTLLFSSEKPSPINQKFNLLDFFEHQVPHAISAFEVSQVGAYSVVLFCVMLCIQIPLLKQYFNKRYQV